MSETFPYTFGKYEIESQLGRGGFGTVYRAQDKVLERYVAIKIMAPELMRDAVWVTRFQQEARMMARLDHPNIVPIYEIGEENGRLFLAMKFIDGNNLADLIVNKGRLEIDTIRTIMSQIADALDYAFSQGVVHRDLKPSNVLMNGNTAALTDFGFARLVQSNSQSISQSGGIVGTPAYIAPEVWEEKEQGRASDIYALGCILYEMLTGKVLFQGESTPAIMLSHFRPPPFAEELPDDVPQSVWTTISKALARDPGQRYTTATEMVEALAQATSDKLAGPYANLIRVMTEQRWQDALRLAGSILAQNPDYRDVEALRTEAQRRLWALEWQEQAQSLFASADYDSALLAITRWQEIVPDDPIARDLLTQIRQAQEQEKASYSSKQPAAKEKPEQAQAPSESGQEWTMAHAEQEQAAAATQQSQEIARLKQVASTAIARQNWETAGKVITRLREIAPNDHEVSTLANRLELGKKETEKAEDIAFWRNQAREAVATQQWHSAQKLVERWLGLAPDDREAKRLLEVINTASVQQQFTDASPQRQPPAPSPRKNWTKAILIGVGLVVLFCALSVVALYLANNQGVPEVVEVEVTRVAEIDIPTPTRAPALATLALTDVPDFSSLESQAVPFEFSGDSSVSPQIVEETATFLSTAALAEGYARLYLDTTFIDLVYAGTPRQLLIGHISELATLGRYEVATIDLENSRIHNINLISDTERVVDACEYWHVATYDNFGQLLSQDTSFRVNPQTITIEYLTSTVEPRWFITNIEFYEPPSFC